MTAPTPRRGARALSPTQAAAELDCSDRHIRVLVAVGELTAFDIAAPGARRPTWRIDRNSLEAFVERRKKNEITGITGIDDIETRCVVQDSNDKDRTL